MSIEVSVLYKILSVIKMVFWRHSKMIYVNSNKKIQSKEDINSCLNTTNYKFIMCQSNFKLGYRHYKLHLLKMKHRLYDILRNYSETNELVYSGFVSPMFAAYDGYCLGDNNKYIFIDCNSSNSKNYRIDYSKKFKEKDYAAPCTSTVNIVFSCSSDIDCSKLTEDTKYEFNEKSGDVVKITYLQEIYSFTKNILNVCKKSRVKRINMYIAAKQPISFVIGTAIQSGDPKVYIYEYFENNYYYPLIIQEAKFDNEH